MRVLPIQSDRPSEGLLEIVRVPLQCSRGARTTSATQSDTWRPDARHRGDGGVEGARDGSAIFVVELSEAACFAHVSEAKHVGSIAAIGDERRRRLDRSGHARTAYERHDGVDLRERTTREMVLTTASGERERRESRPMEHQARRRVVAGAVRGRKPSAVDELLRGAARRGAARPGRAIVSYPARGPRETAVAMKTNAARILDGLGIRYELRDYDPSDQHLTAAQVAERVGFPSEQVFKTLVARGDRTGVCLAVVPGNAELDPKALAHLAGDRKTDTVALKEVQPLTGYVRGGVTAIGCKKSYPVFVDETIALFDVVAVSAGVRGTQIVLSPADYLRATHARVGAIARAPLGG